MTQDRGPSGLEGNTWTIAVLNTENLNTAGHVGLSVACCIRLDK